MVNFFKLIDLDPHSQYGPGTAKSMRIRIHKTAIKCADLDGVRILKRGSYTTYVHSGKENARCRLEIQKKIRIWSDSCQNCGQYIVGTFKAHWFCSVCRLLTPRGENVFLPVLGVTAAGLEPASRRLHLTAEPLLLTTRLTISSAIAVSLFQTNILALKICIPFFLLLTKKLHRS